MQEVVVNTWCDRHAVAGERVVGTPFALSLPGHPARELDLCETCRSDLFDELLQLVADRSRSGEQPTTKAPGKAGKNAKAAPNSAGNSPAGVVGMVVPGQLELTPAGPGDEGYVCPVCATSSRSYPGLEQHVRNHHGTSLPKLFPPQCPVCGELRTAVGNHGKQTHGAENLLELIAQAEQLGDPFEVVAQARELFAQAAAA